MGERQDEVRRRREERRGSASPGRPEDIFGPASESSEREPEEIRADIERTRTEMSETVEAIKEKLSPEHLKEQARERIRGRAREMASGVGRKARGIRYSIVETIRDNPIPAALMGAGLLLLIWERRSASRELESGEEPFLSGEYPEYAEEEPPSEGRLREWGRETSRSAREKAGEFQEKAGEMAGRARKRAGEVTEQARKKAEEIGASAQETAERARETAREQARRARRGFRRLLDENPLALVAAAVAVGAAVGLAIPETEVEHEYMGEAKERLVSKAQEMTREARQKVKEAAEEVKRASGD